MTRVAAHLTLRMTAHVGKDVRLRGPLWAHGGGNITLGDRVQIDGGRIGVELNVSTEGEIHIGSDVVLGPGVSIESRERVVIGNGCRIGAHCKLLDNHLHSLAGDRLRRPPSVPLLLEDGVVVEDYAVLLPGARVGKGARIGRGAIVSRRVPPGASVSAQPVHPARER
jgi:acetyltransferase-like isoleucine patch superfamily enzyme